MGGEVITAGYTGPPKVKCRAHNRDGSPCGNWARLGTSVCRMHGGSAGQVRRKAQERLEAASDRLARALLDIASSAENESVRLAAIRDALDRVGVTGKTSIEVGVTAPWMIVLQKAIVPAMAVEEDDHPEWSMEDGRPPRPSLTPPSHHEPVVVQGEVVQAEPVNVDDTPPARLDPERLSRRGRPRARRKR